MLDELRAAVASAMHVDVPRRRTPKPRKVAESHVASSRSFGPARRAFGEELHRSEVTGGLLAVSREGDFVAFAVAFDEILLLDGVGHMTIAHIPLHWSLSDDGEVHARDAASTPRFAIARLQWLSRCWLLVLRSDGKAMLVPTGLLDVEETAPDNSVSCSECSDDDSAPCAALPCLTVARHAVDIDGLVWSSSTKFAVVAVEHVGVELRRGTIGMGTGAVVCNEPILVCGLVGASAAFTKVAVALVNHAGESSTEVSRLVCAVGTCAAVTTFRITGRDDVVPMRTFLTGTGVRVAGLFADGGSGNWIVAMVEGASPASHSSAKDSADEIVLPPLNDVVGGGDVKTIRISTLSVMAPALSSATSAEAADVPFTVAVLHAPSNELSMLARGFVAPPSSSQTSFTPVVNRDGRLHSLLLWCHGGQAQLLSWIDDDRRVVEVGAPQPRSDDERVLGVSAIPFAESRQGSRGAQQKCCVRNSTAHGAEIHPDITLLAVFGTPVATKSTKRIKQTRDGENEAPHKRIVVECSNIRSDAIHVTLPCVQRKHDASSQPRAAPQGSLSAAEVGTLFDQLQERLEKRIEQLIHEAEDRIVERVTKAIQTSFALT